MIRLIFKKSSFMHPIMMSIKQQWPFSIFGMAMLQHRDSQPAVHVYLWVHLPIWRGTYKVKAHLKHFIFSSYFTQLQ